MILLASASPRRRELLRQWGYELEVRPANVDESVRGDETPAAYVQRVAIAKALAIAAPTGAFVVAADTTVTIDGVILGKPEDGSEAAAMLRRLSGRTHQVLTGFVVASATKIHAEVVTTEVAMMALDDELVAGYVACGEWRDKAGGYAVQGIAGGFVQSIRGSLTNVIGLPLAEVAAALRAIGGPAPRLGRP